MIEAREWMRDMVELSEDTGFLTTAIIRDGKVVGQVEVDLLERADRPSEIEGDVRVADHRADSGGALPLGHALGDRPHPPHHAQARGGRERMGHGGERMQDEDVEAGA